MLFSLGFVCLFTAGGLTGLFLAALGMDMHVHDTYFIIGHFHFIMVGGMVLAYMAGLHYWWPKITGRMYSDWWSKFAAIVIFVGFFLTFLPQFILGYAGMPRRYHTYPAEFQIYNVMSSAGAAVLAAAYLLPLGLGGVYLGRGLQGFGEACLYTGAAAWAVETAGIRRPGEQRTSRGLESPVDCRLGPTGAGVEDQHRRADQRS